MSEAVIVAGVRTPVGKAGKGSFTHVRSDTLAAITVREVLKRAPGIKPEDIEDLILGCAMPEAEQGMNVARMVGLMSGLPDRTAAMTINRYCSSGLQSIALASDRINLGDAEAILAGGLESMSMIPMGGHKIAPNPELVGKRPESYMTMGLTAERVAAKFGITREQQDAFSLRSHQKAFAAIQAGKFKDEIVPVVWTETQLDRHKKEKSIERTLAQDEGPRADTTLEALGGLKPAFKNNGTVTAGNSSQVSDGAAMTLVVSRKFAESRGLKPIARLVKFAVVGCAPEIMGIGPAEAIPAVLKKAGLSKDQIDLIELNEAFASQSLAVLKAIDFPEEKVNVNGGAIALGHPLGCTGTKLTVTLLNELKRRGGKYGIVSMCIGGGMGAAGLFEML
ncbi:MAG: acetyl-CoA C-acyltransferase [Fibrobacteres bacterium]|jgi:acetyl-CoA acyltransferase|nr:acetyl-CoA C-acyltransferase [Fibrobacterota bacterium]